MSRYLRLAPLALVLLGTPVAMANPPKLGSIDIQVQPKSLELTTLVNQALQEELAKQSQFQPGPRSSLGHQELMVGFDCLSFDEACAAQVGRSLGADMILFGQVDQGPDRGWTIQLQMVSAKEGTMVRNIKETALAEGPVLVWTLRRALRQVLDLPTAKLVVSSDQEGAAIALDSMALGKAPLTLSGLAPGAYHLEASKEGVSVSHNVTIKAGDIQTVNLPFPAVAQAPPTPPDKVKGDSQQPLYAKWWFWTSIGVVVAGAITTTALLLATNGDDASLEIRLGGSPAGDPALTRRNP